MSNTRTLKLIATSGALIGLGFAFAPEAGGTFIGAVALGFVMAAEALFHRRRA